MASRPNCRRVGDIAEQQRQRPAVGGGMTVQVGMMFANGDRSAEPDGGSNPPRPTRLLQGVERRRRLPYPRPVSLRIVFVEFT